jgi:predicted CoA-binding protein
MLHDIIDIIYSRLGRRNGLNTEQEILTNCKTVAIVGISADEQRPSHIIGKYLMKQGYRVIPVNPRETRILGETCYPDLKAVPERVDVVNIFRRSEDIQPIVDQAIDIGAGAIWMQEGIKNEQAANKARQAGLKVVQDRCIMKEHRLVSGLDHPTSYNV